MTPPATTPVCNCSVGVLWTREERIVDAYQSVIITTMCFEGHLFYFRFMLEFQQLASFKFNTWLIMFTISCVLGKRQPSTLLVAQLGAFTVSGAFIAWALNLFWWSWSLATNLVYRVHTENEIIITSTMDGGFETAAVFFFCLFVCLMAK